MSIVFLEFCLIVLLLYVFTQLIIPKMFPKMFETNWFFKKNKDREKVNEAIRKKKELEEINKDLEQSIK